MKGLDRAAPADAIAAMRGMNTEAQANPPFLTLFGSNKPAAETKDAETAGS